MLVLPLFVHGTHDFAQDTVLEGRLYILDLVIIIICTKDKQKKPADCLGGTPSARLCSVYTH